MYIPNIYMYINQYSDISSCQCSMCAQRKSKIALTSRLRLLNIYLHRQGQTDLRFLSLYSRKREVFRSGKQHMNVAQCLLRQPVHPSLEGLHLPPFPTPASTL